MSEKEEDRAFQLECIEVYKSLPALWKVKCDDYSNRQKKDAAYVVLIEKFQERYPNYTREDVKKRINTYRTNYRKELKKVLGLEKSGAGTDQVYEPTLWYFHSLAFLNDQEIPAKSRSTLNQPCLASPVDVSGSAQEDDTADVETRTHSNNIIIESQSPLTPTPSTSKGSLNPPSKRMKSRGSAKKDAREELMQLVTESLRQGPEDINLCQARTWAAELSNMTPDQQLFAKKAINDILFEGQMGTLKRDSVKINDDNWVQSCPVTLSSSISDQSLRFVPPSNRVAVGATIPQHVDLSSSTPDRQDYTLAT